MRLIDYDALYQELLISKPAWVWANYTVDDVVKQVLDIVKAQPTVDAVKHGHWIHGSSSDNIRVTCSECRYKVNYFWDSWQDAKYCPNCGARMDGEAE